MFYDENNNLLFSYIGMTFVILDSSFNNIQLIPETPFPNNGGACGSAVDIKDIETTAPGKLRVIKRNGKVVAFEDDKIKVAITKAFLATESGNAAASERIHKKVNQLTENVVEVFQRRMPSGGTLHIEEIQDQVELQLMRSEELDVAKYYI